MSAIIFKRKSKTASRRDSSQEDNTADDDSPSTLADKLKNKTKRIIPKARLSFGGDEDEGEDEAFKVKKSKLSRKLTLGSLPANNTVPASLEQASISPRYDKAYLRQLKADTPTSRPPPVHDDNAYDADMSMDISMDVDESEISYIPSESSIKVAKEKRERLRVTRASGEEDFISLSVIRRTDEPQGPHPSSRLVREEDELGEGDDEFAEYTSAQERIALGKKSKKIEASKRKTAMKELIDDAEEEDDETAEWEQEQLRRGSHNRTPDPSSRQPPKQVYKPAPIPQATVVPVLAPTISRLSAALSQLTVSHSATEAALSTLSEERESVASRNADMRVLVEAAEEKRRWFTQFAAWVEGVAIFLDEKFPQLEKLENEHASLIRERADMISKRRTDEDRDDLSVFLGSIPPTSTKQVEETDDLGRIIPQPSRSTRRAARITRRKQRQSAEEEGYSTDSSIAPSDEAAYKSAVSDIGKNARGVLADVKAPEFRDPSHGFSSSISEAQGLAGWWAQWRERYDDLYTGAWGDLNLVVVWEFWARWEIVQWDFIKEKKSLDSFQWYNGLYEYSRSEGGLVASMISTTVLPAFRKLLDTGVLNVYSEKDIKRMIDTAEEIEASMEGQASKFNVTILEGVQLAFAAAISSTDGLISEFLSQNNNSSFDPESIPARRRFLIRRMKLLKNLLRWKKFADPMQPHSIALNHLVKQLVSRCLLRIANTGWDVGGESIIRDVVNILPNELITDDVQLRLGRFGS